MFIRKLVITSALGAFAFAGTALAAEPSQDALGGQGDPTQYDSTNPQANSPQSALGSQQEVQMKVKKVDEKKNLLTFEVPLSQSASIEDSNQQRINLSELSEGDEVRASFDPMTGDITKVERVNNNDGKDSKGSKTRSTNPANPTGDQQNQEPMGTY